MIRRGLRCDVPEIVELARHFWRETIYDEPFCADSVRLMVELAHEQGLLAVLEEEAGVVGFVAGCKGALLGNAAVLTGTELAWWIEPEYRQGRKGIELMQYIERLAREQGIRYWTMVSMESSSPETANRIYQRLGYAKTETSFTKVL
ncbi:GNAT family N-acetyltransferase [Pseudomonas sp. C9-3]|uniref:GNAT family N-acetyltransferase n=1 Tax=Pseudomonas sp. C9-3 TaxID=3078264 RepID=UPI0028E7192C|nr:GNAT family N-acetyltransferase [Pseudomonas sp. C9-3]